VRGRGRLRATCFDLMTDTKHATLTGTLTIEIPADAISVRPGLHPFFPRDPRHRLVRTHSVWLNARRSCRSVGSTRPAPGSSRRCVRLARHVAMSSVAGRDGHADSQRAASPDRSRLRVPMARRVRAAAVTRRARAVRAADVFNRHAAA